MFKNNRFIEINNIGVRNIRTFGKSSCKSKDESFFNHIIYTYRADTTNKHTQTCIKLLLKSEDLVISKKYKYRLLKMFATMDNYELLNHLRGKIYIDPETPWFYHLNYNLMRNNKEDMLNYIYKNFVMCSKKKRTNTRPVLILQSNTNPKIIFFI